MMLRLALATVISAAVVAANPLVSPKSVAVGEDYVRRLMGKSQPKPSMHQRFLGGGTWVQFERCYQFFEPPEINLAGQQDPDTELTVTQRSVPNPMISNSFAIVHTGDADTTCLQYPFWEFTIDLDEYLEIAVRYQKEIQEKMCESCRETCEGTDIGIDEEEEAANDDATDDDKELRNRSLVDVNCENCVNECDIIENMVANGYIDATEFIQCQMVYDPESAPSLYAGPMCSEDGSKIKIGIFTDEFCTKPDFSKDVENYLLNDKGFSMKLSHALLKKTYASDCIHCTGPYNAFDMCQQLGNAGPIFNGVGREDINDNEVIDSSSGHEHRERNKFVFTLLVIGTAALFFTF